MAFSIKKQYTDNPFIDTLLYCVKILAYGSILKDETKANENETLDSLKKAELYIYAMEGGDDYDMYNYSEKLITKVISAADIMQLNKYVKNKDSIPDKYRPQLIKLARQEVLNTYVERNNYYRMICGLPNYGDKGIPFAPYRYLLPDNEHVDINYVHEAGVDGAKMLELYGIIDAIKADYPNAKYLDYMSAGISIYKARKCIDKQILYMPSSGNESIDDLFQRKFELVRTYVRRRVDSKAMEYGSENYQGFLSAFIFFLTILDMVVEVQDHIIKKDILDARCIEYIFDIYGVPFYKKIPLKYQIMMCKNINSLVQYKSSPQDMLNFISYFGANSIELYKFYLLRDRNTDVWGRYLYNKKTKTTSIENRNAVEHLRITTNNTNTIPFPFEYYLNKGNIMVVWCGTDGNRVRMVEHADYQVYDYTKIRILNNKFSTAHLTYDFYYDPDTKNKDYVIDSENGVRYSYQVIPPNGLTRRKRSYKLELPYSKYLYDGNCLIVSLGGAIIPPTQYVIDMANNTLTFKDGYEVGNRPLYIAYFYSPGTPVKYTVSDGYVVNRSEHIISAYEYPFPNYIINNNSFFITRGSTLISPERYSIDEAGRGVRLNEDCSSGQGQLFFHFIYTEKSVFKEILTRTLFQEIKATSKYQTLFQLDDKIVHYFNKGFEIFVKLRGTYLNKSFFDIYGNSLCINDKTIALQPGEILEIELQYSEEAPNLTVTKQYFNTIADETEFTLELPFDHFYEHGGQIIADLDGTPLDVNELGTDLNGNKFTINTIVNRNVKIYDNSKLCVQLVYNTESDNSARITSQSIPVTTDNQEVFYLNLPFYPYLETGQSFLLFVNSTLVSPSQYTVDKYTLRLKNGRLKKGSLVEVLYVYNNRFVTQRLKLLKYVPVTVPTQKADRDYILDIPVPFTDYIENNWPYFIDDQDRVMVEDNQYEVISGGFVYNNPPDIMKKTSMTFHFIYKNAVPYVTETQSEDFDKDISMMFLKLPLKAFTDTDSYVKMKENTKSYDAMTLVDEFWDGSDGNDDRFAMHQAIKEAIIDEEFNYARTKYLSVNNIIDVAEMSFQIPYFYNMLYDDVFKEDKLYVSIPAISPYHPFKLAHVFCYLTALAYLFNDMNDTIMDKPSKILYVKGFNFHASLEALQQEILDRRRLPSDYNVWDFIIPDGQIPDIKQFINIYNTNKDIYKVICDGMMNARNYDIYSIWKMLHDALMQWEFNLDFFKLADGTQARTFTEFLDEKDSILYTSIKSFEEIDDEGTRQERIIAMIQDIVYILEEYIDSDQFKYIYNNLPGVSSDYLLEYLFTMINFFKSYKVVLNQMTSEFEIKDPASNLLRPNDVQNMNVHLFKKDYITPCIHKYHKNNTTYSDNITNTIRDRISMFRH